MGFLGRILKAPAESQSEEQDEFNAEEKGLLMVPSLPGGEAEPGTREDGIGQAQVYTAEDGLGPDPSEDSEAQPLGSNEDPLDLAAVASGAQGQPKPVADQQPGADEESSDGALDFFRATVIRQSSLPSALRDNLEDVSAAELLAEARSIRNCLLGEGTAAGERGADRRAA